jgi:protein-disulfide isomerase/uncharacterized membrane protein
MINRLILFFSLVGIGLTIHIWIQKERHYDHGCWGVEATQSSPDVSSGCMDSRLQEADEIFGISTVALGYSFYLFTALLAFAKTVSRKALPIINQVSAMAVGVALAISTYLLYVQAIANTYCVLCLASLALVAILCALHILDRRMVSYVPARYNEGGAEIGYSCVIAFGCGGAIVAMLLFVERIGTRRLDQGTEAQQVEAVLAQTYFKYTGARPNQKTAAAKPVARINMDEWIEKDTPFIGTLGKPTVILFLDPNCPHCKTSFANFIALAHKFKELGAFYVLSRPLWDYSILQVEALELAKSGDKYFDLWSAQFENQQKGGMDTATLRALFEKIGLDADDLPKRLVAMEGRVFTSQRKAQISGINSTPTYVIDGVRLAASLTEDNFARLIGEAGSARFGSRGEAHVLPMTAASSPFQAASFIARMQRGREFQKSGEYEAALHEFDTCFSEGSRDPSFRAIRRSFLLQDIRTLGTSYPPAISALKAMRAAAKTSVDMETGDIDAMLDFAAINRALDDEKQTMEYYSQLTQTDPSRKILAGFLFESLVAAQSYNDAALGRPFQRMLDAFEDQTGALTNPKGSEYTASGQDRAIIQAATGVEVLAGAGDVTHARELMARILSIDATPSTFSVLREHLVRAGHEELILQPSTL